MFLFKHIAHNKKIYHVKPNYNISVILWQYYLATVTIHCFVVDSFTSYNASNNLKKLYDVNKSQERNNLGKSDLYNLFENSFLEKTLCF